MRRLSLVGWFLFLIGVALEVIWVYEEVVYNFNYYYYHQVNFLLLVIGGALTLVIGTKLIFWEENQRNKLSKKSSF